MAVIPGREFDMGTRKPGMPDDGEGPRRRVSVSTFLMDKYEVNNLQFSEFVGDTGYVTDAEKWKWSFVLLSSMTPEQVTEAEKASLVRDAPWWAQMFGSYWREPEGPGSHVFKEHEKWGERGNHPAVHISWNDADAFCKWRQGSRLPTEAEWELAARGPVENKVFPWGNVLMPNGTHRLNIFTGEFPEDNTASDGYLHTAPVDAYGPQNDYGMYNMVGNVWEWVSDWWTTQHRRGPVQINPTGPASGQEKVKKGGSFLCHKKFCYRYRNAARFKVETDSGTQNSGFRCAKDVPAAVAASD
jgi:sulfatase modifying factor 1